MRLPRFVKVPANGRFIFSKATIAAAGSTNADATAITTQCVAVTAADGTKGVILPADASDCGPILVINTVAGSALKVYPGSGDTINALAADAAFSVGGGAAAWFLPVSSSAWYVAAVESQTSGNLALLDTANAFTARLTTTDGVASGTARVIGGRAYSAVSAADDLLASAGASAHVDFAQTYSIPANTLKEGSVLKIKGMVRVTDASGTDTLEVKAYLGGTTLLTSTAFDPDAAGDFVMFEAELVARAAPGAAVAITGIAKWVTLDGSTLARAEVILAPTNHATNGALVVKASAKWSATTANTNARLEMLNVEIG